MMKYIYDTHVHTSAGSRCSAVSPEDAVRRFKKMGYTGIFITDHFFNNPSTTVPFQELSWAEAIDRYCQAYESAKAEGDKIGLDVFFGVESSYQGNDILVYGLDKDWWKAHPDILDLPIRQFCELCRSEGGLVVHAHPFREAGYIDLIRLLPRSVDAVEVINGSCSDFCNDRALEYAKNYDLSMTAGSDYHCPKPRVCGVESSVRFASEKEFAEAVRARSVTPVTVFDGRADGTKCE